jgi:hypothetical protein
MVILAIVILAIVGGKTITKNVSEQIVKSYMSVVDSTEFGLTQEQIFKLLTSRQDQ